MKTDCHKAATRKKLLSHFMSKKTTNMISLRSIHYCSDTEH